jgi:hypothetical protein
MFKNKYLSFTLFLISLPVLGMSTSDVYISNLVNQLKHVNAEIKAAEKMWDISRVHIKQAMNASSPELFAILTRAFEKIISNDIFITKMNADVDQQFESIVNKNMSFSAVKIENNLSDFYSKPMHDLGLRLYTAMANKAYCAFLGQKLAQKSKELARMIISLRQTIANDQQGLV